MLFNSLHYIWFYPIVVLLYFLFPKKYRHFLLLIASYYFYMSWKSEYLVLILFTTLVSYIAARAMEKRYKYKKTIFILAILIDFLVLFVFKYFNFANNIIFRTLSLFEVEYSFVELKILLPVGISFYTFQTASYLIDVYKKRQKAEKDIGYFALYVCFFPQLVAGPIERASRLLPQLKKKEPFKMENGLDGFRLMLFGFFKKVVIADRISIVVDQIYSSYSQYSSLMLIIATILFGIQIYCDFSGYSDIAIGSAKIMGIHLMENFRRPYFAKSLREFWRRWHISLSTWFRDYVYIPLGGNKKGKLRMRINLFITFVLSGIWHGANYTFLIWGSIHGIALLVEKQLKFKGNKLIGILPTFIFVQFAWIFFRARSLSEAIGIVKNIFKFNMIYQKTALEMYGIIILIVSIIILFFISVIEEKQINKRILDKISDRQQMVFLAISLIYIIMFGYFSNQEFIYFQF